MGLLDADVAQVDPQALSAVSPQANLPPSLLQRLRGGFDSFQTGLGKFNNGLDAGMQSPLFNLGLGLMSAAQPFADPARSIQGAMSNMLAQRQARQQYGLNQLQIAPMLARLKALGIDPSELGVDMGAMGFKPRQSLLPQPNQAAPTTLLPQEGGSQGGLLSPPAAAPATSSAPSWLTPISAQDIDSTPLGGLDPQYLRTTAAFSQDPAKELADLRAQQIALRKQQEAPILSRLDTLTKSDDPVKYMQADQNLRAAWPVLAAQLGFDPAKDLNAQNVRTAFTFERNALGAPLGEAAVAPNVPLVTSTDQYGRTVQTDPLTGKRTVEAVPTPEKIVGPDGPVNVSPAQAYGKTPFVPSIFGAANMSDQAIQFAADAYRTTGKMPANLGRNPIMQARILDRVAQDALASGDTNGAIAARSAALKANGQGLDQITKLDTATTSYYNTLDKNLTALQELAGKVDSSGSPLINRVYRAWQQGVAGSPDIAKYVTYLRSVESEFAKIQSGALGNQGSSDAARREAQDIINKFMSKGQIDAVAEAMRGEGNNRLTSIREQRQSLMRALSGNAPGTSSGSSTAPAPPPAQAPNSTPAAATPADIQALLKKYGH